MPFTKTGPDTYVSPSGRKFNAAQVRLYYASQGFKRKGRRRKPKDKAADTKKKR